MKRFFPLKLNFHSLSVKDLLEARETYHVYLYNLENVIATAIGRYRILESDPDITDPNKKRPRHNTPPRTLGNSVIKPVH